VLHAIVEGEPGIFPDPVARVMRTIGGWFGRRRGSDTDARRDADDADAGGTDASRRGVDGTGAGRVADDDAPA
jgi:hypothetical protein